MSIGCFVTFPGLFLLHLKGKKFILVWTEQKACPLRCLLLAEGEKNIYITLNLILQLRNPAAATNFIAQTDLALQQLQGK